ncbi:hypothetical protein SAPIO_CDS6974 [Scedosporium apiospermum]|uniref:Cytochrome P450 n=1 Tax=Pseudallescheria apiosperma TaxID=563466 RepID=A0A084G2U4_PSEDA|nr:uncharacterized protein SAPIO_CDS6974 [Scedosporium apiospermum]KEZ41656.1 hypothetical protein SAPIO_CDS6974 [Scedosporium apiospermum]
MDIVEALAARFAVLLAKIEELNLSNATVAAGIFGFLAAVCGVRVTYRWYRLSHVPGPALAGWSKYWIVRESMRGRQPIAIKEVTDKYGYDAMRMDPARDNVFSMRDEVSHTKLRAKMAAGYSGKENLSMEGTIDTQIAKLVQLIETKYLSTAHDYRPMDLGVKGQYFTLDVISDLAFGHAFGFMDKDDDVFDYLKITKSFIPIMLLLADIPALARLLHSRLMRGLLPKESDKLGFGAFIGVTNRVVAERFKPDAPQQHDMLGSFIRHGLNKEEASGEALLQVVAGSDTSATPIRAVMLNLLTNPSAYKRLRDEIDSAIATGKISSPIKNVEARELPYLQAVIKEGLRILPPAGGAFYKTVPPEGDVIDGKFIPGGTQIGSSPFGIHHSKATFGEDADIFRPERWLEAEGERLALMTNTVDMVFHSGKYQCLGKSVALMEFNKIFVELLRRFDFQLANAQKPAEITNALHEIGCEGEEKFDRLFNTPYPLTSRRASSYETMYDV